MLLYRIFGLTLLSTILPTGLLAKQVDCAADWPSESREMCKWEGEEHRPQAIGSSIAARYRPDLTTIDDDDIDDEITDRMIVSMTSIQNDWKTALESAEHDGKLSTRDEPDWPNKWTTRPCCQLTCACYHYMVKTATKKAKKNSKEYNKQRCCYQKMLNDPNCANPPPFEGFHLIEPPWCLR
jgi:hypothetical protein